jgi:hypothetical protein
MSGQQLRIWAALSLTALLGTGFLSEETHGQTTGTPAVQFPSDPASWINTTPLSVDQFAGKGVALYFFRQTSVIGALEMPKIVQEAKFYHDKPVVFIAVNSGYPRTYVEDYLEEIPIPWPVIVDADGALARAAGLGSYPYNEVAVLGADGVFREGDWESMTRTVQLALIGAKWRVEASEVPPTMTTTWKQVEFGAYVAALPGIKKHLFSPKADHKSCAEKLMAAVVQEGEAKWAAAKTQLDLGKKWEAYKLLMPMPAQFKGYTLPPEVASTLKTLPADPDIRNEQAAFKSLETARKGFLSDNPTQKKAGVNLLERLVTAFPNTEAAGRAQALLTAGSRM